MLAAALAALFLLSAPTGPERPQTIEPASHKPTPRLTVLFFTAEWCEPCHAVDLVLEKFLQKNPQKVRVVTVDFDHQPDEVSRWEVRQIPVVILLSDQGEIILRSEGADRQTLRTLESGLEESLKRCGKGN
jgi:thiol-disulfide isomerase/thioredoxin